MTNRAAQTCSASDGDDCQLSIGRRDKTMEEKEGTWERY